MLHSASKYSNREFGLNLLVLCTLIAMQRYQRQEVDTRGLRVAFEQVLPSHRYQ